MTFVRPKFCCKVFQAIGYISPEYPIPSIAAFARPVTSVFKWFIFRLLSIPALSTVARNKLDHSGHSNGLPENSGSFSCQFGSLGSSFGLP